MKKNIIFIAIALLAIAQYACKKNDSAGTPQITSVRSVDSTKKDSFFVRAIPGSLIVIQGMNLSGVQAVFFNDTLAYFNPAFTTDNNIIVTIPASSQTAAANPNVPNLIRVVTDHGTAVYSFTLYLPPPSISSISFDNSGTLVYINGYNFQGITKIKFPVPGTADTALSYTVNSTFTRITAVIPPGTAFNDSLRVYCTFGDGAYSYPPPMTITSVSNENGVAGTRILLTGTNFIGVTKVIFPGGLLGTAIQPISVSQFSVVVPAGINSTDSLRVEGALGKAVSPQLYASYVTHPSPGYLCDFSTQWNGDNTGFVGWTGGYADAAASATASPNNTNGTAVLWQQSPMGANAGPTSQGNGGLLQLNGNPWVANTSDLVSNYSLKFEVFVKTPWSKGQIWISLGDWYDWKYYTARYAPWDNNASDPNVSNGVYQPTGWVTATIPLSKFITGNEFYKTAWSTAGSPAVRFSDYPTTKIAFMIANDVATSVPANSLNIAIDNVRIVKGQ